MFWLELLIILLVVIAIAKPLGTYMYKVLDYEKGLGDKFFSKAEGFVYKICGIDCESSMNWKRYATTFVLTNLFMAFVGFLILNFQTLFSMNVNGATNMDPYLAFNTAISFVTNTNLQHYAGETGVTMLSQTLVIMFLMYVSAASGIATAAAIMRGIAYKTEGIGNFYADLVRILVRILLPLSIIVAIIFAAAGVPQTLGARVDFTTLEGAKQSILTGPIALIEAIKHIGTNGGGFFGANSAHPFENPNLFTNIVEMVSMMIIPFALIFTFGIMIKDKKHSRVIWISLLVLFLGLAAISINSEMNPGKFYSGFNIKSTMGNMEGKDVRFGSKDSAIFSNITTAFTTGSTNSALDSYTPQGGAVPMLFMMLNTVFGGVGSGLENIIMYSILAVFLTGLMVGRTPEYLGNKIETNEVKFVSLAILIHPLLILFATALTLIVPQGVAAMTNPSFHGLSQMLYEFTSASANNGSEFAGFIGNTPYMNILTGIVMLIGRYAPIVLLLAVGGSMAKKTKLEPSPGTFKTDNALFGVLLLVTILIVGALTFFPAIVLGPISEFLSF